MYNPGFESVQIAPTSMKPLLKRRNPFDSETNPKPHVGSYTFFNPCDTAMVLRKCRKEEAQWFRDEYIYGSGMDRKTCIGSCDSDSWLDKSSGITWVGVYGTDLVCVVTWAGVLDIKRVCSSMKLYTIESFLHHFRKTLIAEIEDLADPSPGFPHPDPPNKLRRRANKSIKKPFGIVSVGTNEVPKECDLETLINVYEGEERSVNRVTEVMEHLQKQRGVKKGMPCSLPARAQCDEKNTIQHLQEKLESDPTFTLNKTDQAIEYDVKKAIKSLRERMLSDVDFTADETIQAAISAFQHLFGRKLKASEIGITVLDPEHDEGKYKEYVKELEIHDIEKHLAVINEPGSGGSSSSGRSTVTSLDLDDENEK